MTTSADISKTLRVGQHENIQKYSESNWKRFASVKFDWQLICLDELSVKSDWSKTFLVAFWIFSRWPTRKCPRGETVGCMDTRTLMQSLHHHANVGSLQSISQTTWRSSNLAKNFHRCRHFLLTDFFVLLLFSRSLEPTDKPHRDLDMQTRPRFSPLYMSTKEKADNICNSFPGIVWRHTHTPLSNESYMPVLTIIVRQSNLRKRDASNRHIQLKTIGLI